MSRLKGELIPLVDLGWQYREIEREMMPAVEQLLARGTFILGTDVEAFETDYAAFTGVRHAVGVANGTDALELALRAAGMQPGDEAILPANTFIATAAAVVRAGGTPRLVDCDPRHQLMDPSAIPGAVTARTRFVIPVHLFGQMAPMREVREVATRLNLTVVEDAAQSQGATQGGATPGSFGGLAATSFYPGKNLGAAGDAGAITGDDDELIDRVRLLRDHGARRKYHHEILGMNSRLDALQAIILRAKLRRLHEWNEMRRDAARRYTDLLDSCADIETPGVARDNAHVWHLYVVRVKERDAVLARLQEQGIQAGIHYPIPLHLQPALETAGYTAGDFPVTEALAGEILSLPIYPGISPSQQERVAEALLDAVQ